ncbi:hypothetical protein BH10ACT8_BH10ACT8_21410 [soil metagenome]
MTVSSNQTSANLVAPFTLDVDQAAARITASGELSAAGVAALNDGLDVLLKAQPDEILLDLSAVSSIDADGLGALVRGRLAQVEGGRSLRVARLNAGCRQIFIDAGLSDLLATDSDLPLDQGLGVANLFASVARSLGDAADEGDGTGHLTEVATQLTGCLAAGIIRVKSEVPYLAAASDEALIASILRIAAEVGEGAAEQALAERVDVFADDLAQDASWPRYAQRLVAETPVRSIGAYFLKADGHEMGVLLLCATEPGFFNQERRSVAAILADYTALALAFESELNRADNLQKALQSNREIGVAIGVLMKTYRITDDQAFGLLRTASQNTHRKLHEVAAEVALSGELAPGSRGPQDTVAALAAPASDGPAPADGPKPAEGPAPAAPVLEG